MEIACNPPIYFNDPPPMKGKKVLIVGGTTGVGASLAMKCHLRGALVDVVGLEKNSELPVNQFIFDAASTVRKVEELVIGVDYMFNNVAMIKKINIVDTPRHLLQSFLKVNVESMFMLTQYALKNVKEVVVNMGSKPNFDHYAGMSLYAMTKHSIIDLTLAADEEGKQKFYCMCPSRINTAFRDSVYPNEDKSTRLSPDQVADAIFSLFNGKNPTGVYWLRKLYEKSANSRNI